MTKRSNEMLAPRDRRSEPNTKWADNNMKKLLAGILILLTVCAGLIIWQVWDAKATAAAQRLAEETHEVNLHDAGMKHELLNTRYHMAQIIWPDVPERVELYKTCLEMEESYPGEMSKPPCLKLDKAIQRAFDKK